MPTPTQIRLAGCKPSPRPTALTNDRGGALVGVLLLTAAIFSVGIFGAQSAQVEVSIAGNDLRSEQALALAEAGVHHAFALIKSTGDGTFEKEVADGTGGHTFSKTLDEHNRAVREWRKRIRTEE